MLEKKIKEMTNEEIVEMSKKTNDIELLKELASNISYRECEVEAGENMSKLWNLLGNSGDGLIRDGEAWYDEWLDSQTELQKRLGCYDEEEESFTDKWLEISLEEKEKAMNQEERDLYINEYKDLIGLIYDELTELLEKESSKDVL